MDGDPVKKGDDGQIYLKVSTNSGNLSNDAIYSYDPTEGGKPILRTPANASLSIASFKVDKQKHLIIKSHSPIIDSPSYMRYYTPNVITPINVYYSSNGNVYVRGYNTSPSGDAIILNGDHMNNMSGIIRANLQTNGSPTYDLLYPAMQYYGLGNTSYNMSYISTMFFDNNNNLYGLYDPNALGFEPLVSTAI